MTADVVICTKDRPREVEACIASLAAQVELPARVLLVDVGHLRADLSIAGARLHVEVVASELGLTRQRNAALARVTGDIVLFIDDDVELAPPFLVELRKWFELHPACVGASGNTPGDRRRPRASLLYRRVFDLANDDGVLRASGDAAYLRHPEAPTRVDIFRGHNMGYRMSTVAHLLFDEELGTYGGEDVDFSLRAGRLGELWMVPAAIAVHRHTEAARATQREFCRQVIATAAYLFAKHRAPRQLDGVRLSAGSRDGCWRTHF